MKIVEINDIEQFLYYINLKNDSMETAMWKKEQLTLAYFNQIYSSYHIYLVKEDQNVVGGFLLLDQDETYWSHEENQKPAYYIHKIFILKEYTKQGYMSKIIDWIYQQGIKNNKEAIRLDVRSYLTSLNQHYENLGFKVHRKMQSSLTGEMNLRELKIG